MKDQHNLTKTKQQSIVSRLVRLLATYPLIHFLPPALGSRIPNRNRQRFSLPHQHHQPFAPRNPRIDEIAPQHRVVLSRKRNHYHRIFRSLRLVNADRIGRDDLIELAEVVVDQAAIEIEHQLLGLRVNCMNETAIAPPYRPLAVAREWAIGRDRKSTRLNTSKMS